MSGTTIPQRTRSLRNTLSWALPIATNFSKAYPGGGPIGPILEAATV